jgi:hypothetical protein
MLDALVIEHPAAVQAARAAQVVAALYPGVSIRTAPAVAPALVSIAGGAWAAEDFDPLTVDVQVASTLRRCGRVILRVHEMTGGAAAGRFDAICRQVITRYQRLLDTRNRHSAGPLFDRALALHRRLHDLDRPLPAADHDHSRDTWRWVLRLDSGAGQAV